MDCPVCENAMITLELSEVEIDYCVDCGGIWLDAGELELLLGEAEKAKGLINTFKVKAGCSEKPRKCPICLRKMEKVVVGAAEPELLIDRCRKGDGLWLDKGELQDIIERAKSDDGKRITSVLADMFGSESADS